MSLSRRRSIRSPVNPGMLTNLPPPVVRQTFLEIFWLVIPSLLLFLALPALIRWGWGFWPSLIAASGLTAAAYLLLRPLLRRFGLL